MGDLVEPDQWVWIPDEEDCYIPAKAKGAFHIGEPCQVLSEDGEDVKLDSSKDVLPLNEEVLNHNIDNLINFKDLNERALLHNLRQRFKHDLIYTYVSSILISVNPFKLLPIYTPEVLESYRQGSRGKSPHVFAIADNAYNNMVNEQKDQSVVISGESGAGKSEATKLILQYIAEASSRASGIRAKENSLEQQILQSNPIMEAFGNAKTVRNNNSSRFGKLITVYFDGSGSVSGGSIISYLLEKSRVVGQSEGERNYHIFYQLIAGGEAYPQLKQELSLDSASMFQYTNQSGVDKIPGVSDEKDFEEVKSAMDTLNITEEEQMNVFRTVAAVLHSGNLKFDKVENSTSEDGSKIANDECTQIVAKLLSVDEDVLNTVLTSKRMGTRSVVIVPYTKSQAMQARDAMTKAVYSKLFDWLMSKINLTLSGGKEHDKSHKMIGVLDIFGFESFEHNSFEQLCINYCNEKLQFHFNEHIFRLEQEVYAAEGVNVPATDFKDNSATLSLLEAKAQGIFSMIDEEISVPRGSDGGFLNKVTQKHMKHESFEKPKPKSCSDFSNCFGVKHYAGTVFYNSANFLEKNKDTLHQDISGALSTSSSPFVKGLFPPPEPTAAGSVRGGRMGGRGGASAAKTLGWQFKTQLASLMETLNSTFPHFVRCMKPNSLKQGSIFESEMMLAQLRYAGLLEVCRIRKLGFPIRRDFDEFYKRYRCIVPGTPDLDALVAGMEKENFILQGQWAKGKTQMFLKTEQNSHLEAQREESFAKVAVRAQTAVRAWLGRKHYAVWKVTLRELEAALESKDIPTLEHVIEEATSLPFHGVHIPALKQVKALKARLVEEERIKQQLKDAVGNRDLDELVVAVQAAETLAPPLEDPVVGEAKGLIELIREEIAVKKALKEAINNRDKAALDTLLEKAKVLNIDSEEVKQAASLKARIEEEESLTADIAKAISQRSLSALSSLLNKARDMGLENPTVSEGVALEKQINAEIQATKALVDACKERSINALAPSIDKALNVGLIPSTCKELEEAQQLLALVEEEKASIQELVDATESRDLERITTALAKAESLKVSDCNEYTECMQVKENLIAINTCKKMLVEATSAEDSSQLSSGLSEAVKLGIVGPEVDAARAVSKKLGAQSAIRTKLADLLDSEDLDTMKAAIQEAIDLKQDNCSEASELKQRIDFIEQETAVVAELKNLMASENSSSDIQKCLSKFTKLGISNKYAADVSAAKEYCSNLDGYSGACEALTVAIKSKDISGLEEALKLAEKYKVEVEKVTPANDLLLQLQGDAELLSSINAACQDKDFTLLETLMIKAEGTSIKHEDLVAAKSILARSKNIGKATEILQIAIEKRSLASLNKAITEAMEVGINSSTPEMRAANALKEELVRIEGIEKQLKAAQRTLISKARGENGISKKDLKVLEDTIQSVEVSDKESDAVSTFVQKAQEILAKMEQQIEVQAALVDALQSEDINIIKSAVDAAEDMELNQLENLSKAKQHLKELSAGGQDELYDESEDAEVDQDEIEQQRTDRRNRARNPKYHFKNFSGLRSPDDYAKGVVLQRKKVKDSMLKWQSTLITKSLVELDANNNKISIQLHKSLLGYMGDKQMAFPATLARDILQKGYELPELRDEIYTLILKQLTGNQRVESIAKGWQMLCMCTGTFPPSVAFADYLLNYILEKEGSKGAIRNYARYCLITLEGMLASGPTGFIPSVEEISAYKERPPILATIELVNGNLISEELPVTPDLNVAKVADICRVFLEISDKRMKNFGIFVYDTEENMNDPKAATQVQDLPRTPRPLSDNEYMGQIFVDRIRQRRTYKFVFKRKIFLPSDQYSTDDYVYRYLNYIQIEDDSLISGNLGVENEEDASKLAAISIIINYLEGDYTEANVIEFLPPAWREIKEENEWQEEVMAICGEIAEKDADELRDEFLAILEKDPFFGAHMFHVQKLSNEGLTGHLPKDLTFAFNSAGLHVLNTETGDKIKTFFFQDIVKWGGSSSTFSLVLVDSDRNEQFELIVTTAQAQDMASIIMDYINAIMESGEF